MHPTLFWLDLGGHQLGLHSYGILVGLGLAIGVLLFWREGREQGLEGGRLLDLAFWCIIAGLAGSRAAFVALNLGDFAEACLGVAGRAPPTGWLWGCTAALRFWEGGLVFYGGALAAALVVLAFCRREGLSFWRLGDLAAPALAAGHVVGRLGCFLAGCCFGKGCATRFGVSFPSDSAVYQELLETGVLSPGAPTTPPLHATQLYEAAGELAIFFLLVGLRHRWCGPDRRLAADGLATRPPGGLVLTYGAAYAVLRFVVEIFRGDVSRHYVIERAWPRLAVALGLPPGEPIVLSVSQLASLLLLGVVLGLWLWRRRPRSEAS